MSFQQIWWQFLLLIVCSYAIGNINFALIISKKMNKDVRSIGSGNPGTLNMSRNFGLKIGGLTLILDMLKGGIPTLIGYLLFKGKYFIGTDFEICDLSRIICGTSVVIGHIFPVALKFKGGKGIASTLGALTFCEPLYAIIVLALTLLYIYWTEWGSMGSLIGVNGLVIVQCILLINKYDGKITGIFLSVTFALLALICFLTWFAHRKNIVRLLSGEEHATSVKKMAADKK